MTRIRADEATLAPTVQPALHYAQRASRGGVLITDYGSGAKGYADYPYRPELGDPRVRTYTLMEQSRFGVSLKDSQQSHSNRRECCP